LILERSTKSHNYSACLRTAEALGVCQVWCVLPPSFEKDTEKRAHRQGGKQWLDDEKELRQHVAFAKRANQYLDVRDFESTADMLVALKESGRKLWVTDLSQHAESLGQGVATTAQLPERLAIAFGTELSGASRELLNAADKRVYLPLTGFADSLNLSVACALVMHSLLERCPDAVGDTSVELRSSLRLRFYPEMARKPEQVVYFTKVAQDMNARDVAGDLCVDIASAADDEVAPFRDMRRCEVHRAHAGANLAAPATGPDDARRISPEHITAAATADQK
jgi:tRNA(Leu) C34 or U34 (ribose-2'-O)-methylase TrmL